MIRKCKICGSHFIAGGALVIQDKRLPVCSKKCIEIAYDIFHVQIEVVLQKKAA